MIRTRKQFVALIASTLQAFFRDGTTTREQLAEDADTSYATACVWAQPTNGSRLPDLHDLHVLLMNDPAVGSALLALVTDGTCRRIVEVGDCHPDGSLKLGLRRAIAAMQVEAKVVADLEHFELMKVVDCDNSAQTVKELDDTIELLRRARATVLKFTAVRQGERGVA